ncbi:NuA4 histone H4 acetyltransferase complex and the SWR1 complex subunit [Pichia californica]|uniref:Protein AF-9 homolog n=1 Tax=Pichia californica TaxID=460514 RepID=A0A9P6WRT3_9ASCO|nr:NuA4 histone H4 acetyltransferase complex and the SWR1 complex subunit [[Candida] californica]KAG0691433.1 NuA4 histone H4 acetyltransferase complex and the SWR1 complex subunit [[Candida] californica]
MAPSGSSNKRIKQVSISKPILYGNIATKFSPVNPMPINAPKDHTHSWTIFVKDPTNNDLSSYIKKVVFKLHDTYPNSTRTIESPPFEVTETGWGEFEIIIKIFFHTEGGEKNITLIHHLKLHPYDGIISMDGKVESVRYDEIVFNEPTESMFSLLTKQPGTLLDDKLKLREREELDRISKAIDDIQSKIVISTEEFKNLDKERENLVEL